jgi:nitroreductase
MSPAQKTLRDAAIVAALHAGEQVKDVAKTYGITPRSVQRIFEAFRMRPTAIDSQPMQIIERAIRQYEQQMQSFAAVAENTIERAPAVAVAALKGHADSLERYLRLLSDVGKLPTNLELFRNESDMRQVGRIMAEVLQRVANGELSGLEAAERFDDLVFRRSSLVWDGSESVGELESGEEAA